MPPILQEALGSIVRTGLVFLAAYLIKAGIWTEEEAGRYITAGVVLILTVGWSLWQKYRSRQKLNVALATPHTMTEKAAEAAVARGEAPSVTTPKAEIPKSAGT
jgi:hypothetical protein